MVFFGKFSSEAFTAFISSEFGILVHSDLTSKGTKYELSGTASMASSFLWKSVVSLM